MFGRVAAVLVLFICLGLPSPSAPQPAGPWIVEIEFDSSRQYSGILGLLLYRQGRPGCRWDQRDGFYFFTQCNNGILETYRGIGPLCTSAYLRSSRELYNLTDAIGVRTELCLDFQADFLPSLMSVFGMRDYDFTNYYMVPMYSRCNATEISWIKLGRGSVVCYEEPSGESFSRYSKNQQVTAVTPAPGFLPPIPPAPPAPAPPPEEQPPTAATPTTSPPRTSISSSIHEVGVGVAILVCLVLFFIQA